MDQYIGRLLDDRYEILEVIGTGGMAVVYKALCHRLNRLVAIKILKDEFAGDEEFRRRFRAEGEAVAMLSHPNIVQVYDVSSVGGVNFIVMELIDGISLKQYMEKKGVLNWKETLHFAMQIAKGLEHAHSRGIVHRDIKPHNVMVLKNGSVKVMDFGIARVMNKSNTLTKEALGSVHYISPEQAKGGHTDNRSDIYSLGVVMYEMMTGRPPYDGESAVAVAIQHINGGARRPSALNPNIPYGLEQIIMKAMALEVRDRYVSATEMLQDMEEFRKNPAIAFPYHFLTDDATQVIHPDSMPGGGKLTTAEKKVMAKTGQKPAPERMSLHRKNAAPTRELPTSAKDPLTERRTTRQQVKDKKKEEQRNRVAATAIVVCSAVAVMAIIVFLVALFNGALLDQERDLVDVPYLQGQTFDDGLAEHYGDFNIHLNPKQYHDTYPEGQIIDQQPAGGMKVQRGSDLYITVSMGPEPESKRMDNFVGASAEEAYALLEKQGYKPLTKKEPSYVYDAGVVTRTDPAANEEVKEGQTVYIYVSSGPDIVMQFMPELIGMDVEAAKKVMEPLGFTNVRYEPTESQRPVNEVVFQSVDKNKELDVTTQIIIQYSAGLQVETEPPEETTPPVTITVSFDVPERKVEYMLEVRRKGEDTVLASKQVPPGQTSTYVELTGRGTVYYDLYVDGEYLRTQEVYFDSSPAEE